MSTTGDRSTSTTRIADERMPGQRLIGLHEGYRDVNEGRRHYAEAADGPLVVPLHGLTAPECRTDGFHWVHHDDDHRVTQLLGNCFGPKEPVQWTSPFARRKDDRQHHNEAERVT